jgi:predicted esterase
VRAAEPAATDPHAGQPLLRTGPPPAEAAAAAIFVHGRGGSARDILTLADELDLPDLACVAPQAAGSTWYPYSFLAPIERNEPGLSSALSVVAGLVRELESEGIPPTRVLIAGFSQGACLAAEFAARHAGRFGGIAVLTGGLIGPDATPRDYEGDFDGTPVFLGSSDPDPHVPWSRVEETAAVFEGLGASVDLRRYPGMGHTVNEEELEAVRGLAAALSEDR